MQQRLIPKPLRCQGLERAKRSQESGLRKQKSGVQAVISRFFIDRPIFASVISIVITLAGAISIRTLPLAQFPQVTPPTVQVTANYPGASAKDVADAVAAP